MKINITKGENNLGSVIPTTSYLREFSEEKMDNLIKDLWTEWAEWYKPLYGKLMRDKSHNIHKFPEWLVMTGAFHLYSSTLEVRTEWPIIEVHLD